MCFDSKRFSAKSFLLRCKILQSFLLRCTCSLQIMVALVLAQVFNRSHVSLSLSLSHLFHHGNPTQAHPEPAAHLTSSRPPSPAVCHSPPALHYICKSFILLWFPVLFWFPLLFLLLIRNQRHLEVILARQWYCVAAYRRRFTHSRFLLLKSCGMREGGGYFGSLLNSKAFQEMVHLKMKIQSLFTQPLVLSMTFCVCGTQQELNVLGMFCMSHIDHFLCFSDCSFLFVA